MKKAFITSGPGHVHSLAIAFAACTIEIFIKVILDPLDTGVKVFRIIPEFSILRLTFLRKSASKC